MNQETFENQIDEAVTEVYPTVVDEEAEDNGIGQKIVGTLIIAGGSIVCYKLGKKAFTFVKKKYTEYKARKSRTKDDSVIEDENEDSEE